MATHLENRQQLFDLIAKDTDLSYDAVKSVYDNLIAYDMIDYDVEKEVFSELFNDE